MICEYCDQGVHYSCLSPPPEKRPKVWDCDDCLIARGKPPNNNVSDIPFERPNNQKLFIFCSSILRLESL